MNDYLTQFINELSSKTANMKIQCKDVPFEGAAEERFGFDRCYVAADFENGDRKRFLTLIRELYEERLKNKIDRAIMGIEHGIDLPFPLAVLSIESSSYNDMQDLLYTLFESVFSYISNNTLNVFLPIDTVENLEESVSAVHESITEDLYLKARIGVGMLSKSDIDLKLSFQTSRAALKLCSEFKKDVVFYHKEWLEMLILSIPERARTEFVRENFKNPDILSDNETLKTITTFLNCSLNLSKASRLLFIHRNTLSYRLDKIHSETGLDIRNFEDAMKMKLCLEILDLGQI
ncbi:MAG: helix-turn-helix domain-containing protein [Thermoanaerobacteraceae bacterium]|nr:helix-turn-helix domain-containing protein [Thermoanaerobacteraceae bacterium]